uniref:ras GTPase-activating protein 1 n=1 Tax=Ciona intestinalis TaxID=7719 RepID=UPI000052352E|nr:ras GTPase-activating protein 1 [Ciona intestinalis]|eukprot:XP_002127238.1 ras GTPase-activating protein 1 [Ciona intestinalis]
MMSAQYNQWANHVHTNLDEASYEQEVEVHEDELVAMMSGSHEFSIDGDHVEVPAKSFWYHGKLDRRIAEERLLEVNVAGGYLVRESQKKPGSYVLSFLSENIGMTHFRIISVCGDFYIGGRQFECLEQLIAYYTHRSCLLEGEVLRTPIQPPEPVDDRRRVQAILPYQKVPDADNDEISFEKDDIFIVQDDMEGDWMWLESLRTNERGCVFRGLVRDIGDVDPHEGKEWFHAGITKEEAYSLLSAVDRSGSFLIRVSDSTPGDYVLYFFTGQYIQRFKLHRVGQNRFEMGGRCYGSIDEVVEHYRHEQIVEGHTLTYAVPKSTDISRECKVDIYETINRATSSQLSRAIIHESGVLKKGQLLKKGMGKRSHDNKKWKPMFFVLHGEKQHLYYFEHEKKTKPKGLIDLSYGAVYPVHESYFGRPHCFQVVIRALNEVTSSYFCADSADLAQEWMKLLRANCAKPNRQALPKLNSARQVRSVQVTIEAAHKLASRTTCRPYCTLSLNNVHVGRTKVKEDLKPVWSEEFLFDDIPPDVDSFTVGVHNAARRSKHSSIGEVVVHFSKLSAGKVIDEWHNLTPISTGSVSATPAPSCGSVRIRARYSNELIMPVEEYEMLKKLVGSDLKMISSLAQVCGQDRTLLASVLLKIFRQERKEKDLIRMLNEREIMSKDSEPGTLFRATTLASTIMEQYMRTTCPTFVSLALKDVVKQIVESRQSCELNPAKLHPDDKDTFTNKETLLGYLRCVLSSIFDCQSLFPNDLRYVFGHMQQCVTRRWPHDKYVRVRVVSGFMFLRLLCPAIINPKMFNMVSETPSPTAARSLLLVAKSLQNLANLVEYGSKEYYMECLNPFIIENKEKITYFLEELGSASNLNHNTRTYGPKSDITRDLASLHQICKDHIPELQALSTKEYSLKSLLGVIELLNKKQSSFQQKLRQER